MAEEAPKGQGSRISKGNGLGGSFLSPQTALGTLDAGEAASLIAAAADITLIIGADGVILDLSIQNDELLADLDGGGRLVGQGLLQVLSPESRPKATALLADGARSETRWRHINHLAADGRSVPVLYCCVQLGAQGRLVAFGRDLRAMSALQQRLMNAQASLEQDYGRLRDAEMRYRLLFQTSSEAVVILDPARSRVVEANPAAREMFGVDVREIVGSGLVQRFSQAGQGPVGSYLAAIRAGETQEPLRTYLVHAQREVLVRATAFRQDSATMLLVRISSAHAVEAAATLSAAKAANVRSMSDSSIP